MKKNLTLIIRSSLILIPIILCLICAVASVYGACYAYFAEPSEAVSNSAESCSLPAEKDLTNVPFTVLDKKLGRVVSNKTVSEVVLKAKYADKSLYARDVTIDINDKNGKTIAVIHPKTNGGYAPRIQLLPFDDSGLKQIFLGMDSGGSGGYGFNYVFSAENAKITTLFDYETFNAKSVYTAEYLNGYKVKVQSADNKTLFLIDISDRPKDYLSQIYNPDGTLIKPQSADVNAVSAVFPYFNGSIGTYQLAVYQRVTGLYNADGLGNLLTRLSLKGRTFVPLFVSLEIYPSSPQIQ